jgi:hypothetical protein
MISFLFATRSFCKWLIIVFLLIFGIMFFFFLDFKPAKIDVLAANHVELVSIGLIYLTSFGLSS